MNFTTNQLLFNGVYRDLLIGLLSEALVLCVFHESAQATVVTC